MPQKDSTSAMVAREFGNMDPALRRALRIWGAIGLSVVFLAGVVAQLVERMSALFVGFLVIFAVLFFAMIAPVFTLKLLPGLGSLAARLFPVLRPKLGIEGRTRDSGPPGGMVDRRNNNK